MPPLAVAKTSDSLAGSDPPREPDNTKAISPVRAPIRLRECLASGSRFAALVDEQARRSRVDPRALSVRTLLHLPRVARASGRLTTAQIGRELARAAKQLAHDVRAAAGLVATSGHPLGDLRFERIQATHADAVFSTLHYLRSARAGSVNFALVDPVHRLPVSLCSVSPLEWRRVGNYIHRQFGVPPTRIWDVSRVYSSDLAPPNAISFLLARVRAALRHSGADVDLLTTAVDPNLGFTGSSYRAANWRQWLTIHPRPYLYHDGRYVSPRQLLRQFGTANLDVLNAQHPGQAFERSEAPLLDSFIYCWRLRGETESVDPTELCRLRR